MPLLSYAEARPWAKSIKEAVASRRMPPWHADPHYGKFSNDRSLTQAEINTLVAWADGGAPQGNAKDAPPPREFADGWQIGKPDLVLDTGVDFKVPAQGTIEYTHFVVPTGFTEDKWVKEIEVRPGQQGRGASRGSLRAAQGFTIHGRRQAGCALRSAECRTSSRPASAAGRSGVISTASMEAPTKWSASTFRVASRTALCRARLA